VPLQLSDTAVYWKNLAAIAGKALGQAARNNPARLFSNARQYPWLASFGAAPRLYHLLVGSRSGAYRQANARLLRAIFFHGTEAVHTLFDQPERLVLNEDLVPPEILFAMGLNSWFTEYLGFLLPMLQPELAEKYLDIADNAGVPPDICSLPRHIMGIAHAGNLPKPGAVITSNSPCDGGMASYTVIGRQLGVPVFYLDVPYNFYSERAADYFAGELESLIAWLEKHTPGRMDFDKLARICWLRNSMMETESALWDMLRARPAPLAAEAVYLTHLWSFIVRPGTQEALSLLEDITCLAKKNFDAQKGAVEKEQVRAFLWGVFPAFLTRMWVWAEKTYGLSFIMDSLSFSRLSPIDISSEKSMLRDLGRHIMAGPMARHSRGPMENYFDDLFFAVENFDIDMLMMSGHIGCKNAQALNGILREKCRERGLPLLVMEYDMSDPRIVNEKGVYAQVEHFMENVMRVKRLV
jgi:hypothetical protein